MPDVAGLSVAAHYVPVSAVAGDFYDVMSETENRISVIVADVTGHGVPAALVASMMKLACSSDEELMNPSRGLARANRLLCRSAIDQFVTAACSSWRHCRTRATRAAIPPHKGTAFPAAGSISGVGSFD